MDIKTVPQPPQSPDLAPCDFCLFPKLRGCRYETIEEIKEAVTKVIDTLTPEDFHGAFFFNVLHGPTWNINVTRKLNLRNGFSGFSNISDIGPFIPWSEFFWPTWNLLGCFVLIFYVTIQCTPWSIDFLGNFLLRMPIFFKSIDHFFLVICKRIATSHDLFLIFIAKFYVEINLNIKICELIYFIQ